MSPFATHSDLLPAAAAPHTLPCKPGVANQAQPCLRVLLEECNLLHLLEGCCHPRATRLREQLSVHPDARQISALSDEVLRLLTVCYGAAEVRRRLHKLTESV